MCRKIAFIGVCAEIFLSRDKVPLDSGAEGHFRGLCRNINFWRNIHLWAMLAGSLYVFGAVKLNYSA